MRGTAKVTNANARFGGFGLPQLSHAIWGGDPKRKNPKGPKIEKIQDRPPGLKFSIEIENFNPDPQQPLLFVGNSEGQD